MYRSIEIHRALSWWRCRNFNPRSPDGERRRCGQSLSISFIFQSTLPGWGATLNRRQTRKHFGSISIHAPRMGSDPTHCPISRSRRYFNPRSPDGERHFTACAASLRSRFQSTLPGWGATPPLAPSAQVFLVFQSTLPGWGATVVGTKYWISAYVFQSTLPGWGATKSAWYLAKD